MIIITEPMIRLFIASLIKLWKLPIISQNHFLQGVDFKDHSVTCRVDIELL